MSAGEDVFEFGRFRLDQSTRVLLDKDSPVAISSRAFDILQLLIAHRDRIVTKDEIISRVWRGMIVDDNNLAVQISALRRVLSDHDGNDNNTQVILTIPGRGYRFVGKVRGDIPAADVVPVLAQPLPAEGKGRGRWGAWLAAAVLLAAVGIGYLVYRSVPRATPNASDSSAKPAPRLSIVVMPFRNLGDNPEDSYLADAVSDDLTTDLSHLPKSVVIARTSADTYKGRAIGAAQIGRELDVRYLLEGSLRRAGDQITINAQLIDTETGAHLWAERFDVSRQGLADAQTAIVRHIASALNFTLVQIEGQRSLQDRPKDPDAVDLFFRARSQLEREGSLEAFSSAQTLLEKSLQLQPDFVDATSELAWLLLRKVRYFDDPTDAQDMENARKLVQRALTLAPRNARVLAARGFLLKLDGKCEEAIASNQLALTFDPSNIDALSGIALCTANLGHPEEADRNLKELLRIDPQSPTNRVRYGQLGLVNLMIGRNEEAIDWFQKSLADNPHPSESTDILSQAEYNEIGLIAAYGLIGRKSDAQSRYADYSRRLPNRTVWRIQSYFTKAEANLPGFRAAMASLKQAGMPEFADELADFHVAPPTQPKMAGDFEPTPTTIPGAKVLTTHTFSDLMAKASVVIVDVGRGAATVPGAHFIGGQAFPSDAGDEELRRTVRDGTTDAKIKPIVVMGTGPFDWYSYNATLTLLTAGYRDVWWYRGGEESWVAAGMKFEDRRDP